MTIQLSSYDQLIIEFSDIKVEIEVSCDSYQDGSLIHYDIDEQGNGVEYCDEKYFFKLKFQDEDKVPNTSLENYTINYSKRIDALRLAFYKEVTDQVENNNDKSTLLHQLSDCKLRFNELRDNYYVEYYNTNGGRLEYLNNKTIQTIYSEIKPIFDLERASILHHFLIIQLDAIQKIIKYLKLNIKLLKQVPNVKTKEISPEKPDIQQNQKKSLPNSFTLNPEIYKTDKIVIEKLKEFHEGLKTYGYINNIEFRNFLHAFTDKRVKEQIRWEGDAKELYYLLKTLHEKKILLPLTSYWEVGCKCFIAYHKKTQLCTPFSLSRCHPPTLGEQRRRLNSVIDALKVS